jgi:hypothetical protein
LSIIIFLNISPKGLSSAGTALSEIILLILTYFDSIGVFKIISPLLSKK